MSDPQVVSPDVAGSSPALESWLAQTLPTLSAAAKRFRSRKSTVTAIGFVTFFAVLVVAAILLHAGKLGPLLGLAVIALIVAAIVAAIFERILVKPLEKARQTMIEEMQASIKQQALPTGEIVRRIAKEEKRSDYRDAVMQGLDATESTLLLNHDEVLNLLDALQKVFVGQMQVFPVIGQVGQLQSFAYTYAKSGFYAEAIAMLCTAELLYKSIAIAAPQLQWTSGNMRYSAKAPWGAFSYRNEVTRLSDIFARRRVAPQMLAMLKAMLGQTEAADLLSADRTVSIEIRDQEIIDKCQAVATVGSLLAASEGGLETILTMSYMPGYPTMLDQAAATVFKNNAFVPQLIDACIRRGNEMEPSLLKMFTTGGSNESFNSALALGILKSAQAAAAAPDLLSRSTDALTRIGALFVLVHAGQTERQQEIIPYLDDHSELISHAAAIALEHLLVPVPDAVLVSHLGAPLHLIRLRLARHVKRYTEVSPAVRSAVEALVTDPNSDVGLAAAETMTSILSGDALYAFAVDRLTAAGSALDVRRRSMLMLGHAATDPAVDLLLKEWGAVRKNTSAKEYATALLGYLGDSHSLKAVPVLIDALKNDDHKLTALTSLLSVGAAHTQEVHAAASRIHNTVIRTFVQAFLSNDAKEVEAFKRQLGPATDDGILALQLAALLPHPALEDRLNTLRVAASGNEIQAPTLRWLATRAALSLVTRRD